MCIHPQNSDELKVHTLGSMKIRAISIFMPFIPFRNSANVVFHVHIIITKKSFFSTISDDQLSTPFLQVPSIFYTASSC